MNDDLLAASSVSRNERHQHRIALDSRAFRSIQSTLIREKKKADDDQTTSELIPTNSRPFFRFHDVSAANCDQKIQSRNSDWRFSVKYRQKEPVSIEYLEEKLELLASNQTLLSFSQLLSLFDGCIQGLNDKSQWEFFIHRYLLYYTFKCENDVFSDFVVKLSYTLIGSPMFQDAMFVVLNRNMNDLMTPCNEMDETTSKRRTLCNLFSQFLVAKWPHDHDKCVKECNSILFAIMNTVHWWLTVLNEQSNDRDCLSSSMSEVCAVCLLQMCAITDRRLWLQWPTLVDDIYETLKKALSSPETTLSRDTRKQLLDLFVRINEWPKRNRASKIGVHKAVQTHFTEFYL